MSTYNNHYIFDLPNLNEPNLTKTELNLNVFSGSPSGRHPAGRHQRPADEPTPPPVAQRLSQPVAVVRLRLHPQVGPLAEPQVEPDRGVGQLLRDEIRISPRSPRRRPEQARPAG